jgi:multidrug efflux pump subunit AcrA (membrane-fusion protein)
MRLLLLCCLSMTALLAGEAATWEPHANPATLRRAFTGFTQPFRVLDLAAEDSGRLASVNVEVGQRTPSASTAIIVLDSVFAELAITQAKAAEATAQAEVVARSKAVEVSRRDLEQADRELARAERMFKDRTISDAQRDTALSARDKARAAVAAGEAQASAAATTVIAAAAQRREAELRLARRRVAAPGGWLVLERLREPGAMVGPGEAILRLADVSQLLVSFRVDEGELEQIRRLDRTGRVPLRFVTAGGGQRRAEARIRRVDPTFDPVSRKRLLELVLPASQAPEASGGLEVELTLDLPDLAGGLRIPMAYVGTTFERQFVRSEDGRELVPVVVRREGESLIVAADSLPTGIRLVPITP